uniref:uncharacterized protein n=1 Tax=Penicillium odoratum TaxID=1167516 RepID=UPI00254697F4|nr:uncharacterized protein N7520_000493 [Penicillium odoratum]KAJ5777247.1 hypothetical protein N7520_000493 [Penicillium odoratum]
MYRASWYAINGGTRPESFHVPTDTAQSAVEKSLDSTNDATQPPVGHILVLSDFTDRKALFFWFLEVTNMLSFVFWLIVATYMAGIHLSFNPMTPWHIGEPEFNLFSRQIIGKILARENSTSLHAAKYSMKQVFVDVWFALSLMVAVDASAVVFTFNRPLIRKFHHVVSQRLMSLASILSFAIFSWNKEKTNFGSRYPAGSLALGLAAYLLLGSALDMLERRMPSHSVPCRRGTLAQYSKALGHSETSWTRALFLTTVVGGVGLFFTMLIPPPWSALVPFIHILLEVC